MKMGNVRDKTKKTSEILGGSTLLQSLRVLFNQCLTKAITEQQNAEVILPFKKGDNTNIGNYLSVSHLSRLMKILTKRLLAKLDSYQPVEQAGFQMEFSTLDHLQAIKLLLEKAHGYNTQLQMAFVEYHKTFDTTEKWTSKTYMKTLLSRLTSSKILLLIKFGSTEMSVSETQYPRKYLPWLWKKSSKIQI